MISKHTYATYTNLVVDRLISINNKLSTNRDLTYRRKLSEMLDHLGIMGYGQWLFDAERQGDLVFTNRAQACLCGIHEQTGKQVKFLVYKIYGSTTLKNLSFSLLDLSGECLAIGQYDRVLKLTDTMTMESWYDGEPWTENSMRMYMAIQHRRISHLRPNLDMQRALTDLPAILLERGFKIHKYTQLHLVGGIFSSLALCPGLYGTYGSTEIWMRMRYNYHSDLMIWMMANTHSGDIDKRYQQLGYIGINDDHKVNDTNLNVDTLLFGR